MSKILSIRDSINTQLNKWEDAATALQEQLDLTRNQVEERLEGKKDQLNDALNTFKENVEHAKEISSEKKAKIESQIDDLRDQITFGKAEAKDIFLQQKQQLLNAISTFEDVLDQEVESIEGQFDDNLGNAADALINSANKFEAELEAAGAQYEIEQEKLSTGFQEKRDTINSHINEFKSNLEMKRKEAKEKGESFEQEISSGLSQIKDAFNNLLH